MSRGRFFGWVDLYYHYYIITMSGKTCPDKTRQRRGVMKKIWLVAMLTGVAVTYFDELILVTNAENPFIHVTQIGVIAIPPIAGVFFGIIRGTTEYLNSERWSWTPVVASTALVIATAYLTSYLLH